MLNTVNNINSLTHRQVLNENYLSPLELPGFNNTSSTFRIIFYALLSHLKHDRWYIAPSLDMIAARSGFSKATVSRAMKYFKDMNWISCKHRFNNSNIYEVHPMFTTPEILQFISKLYRLSVNTVLTLAMLFSTCGLHPSVENLKEVLCINNLSNQTVIERENPKREVLEGEDYRNLEQEGGLVSTILPNIHGSSQKKGSRMNQIAFKNKETTLDEIATKLPLTQHGVIMIMKYPAQSLHYMNLNIESCLLMENPAEQLFRYLDKHATTNQLFIDEELYDNYCEQKGVNKNLDPLLDPDAFNALVALRKKHPVSKTVQRRAAIASLTKNKTTKEKPDGPRYNPQSYVKYEPEPLKDVSYYEQERKDTISLLSSIADQNPYARLVVNMLSQQEGGCQAKETT